jgi:large subunit ribosomal protein L28
VPTTHPTNVWDIETEQGSEVTVKGCAWSSLEFSGSFREFASQVLSFWSDVMAQVCELCGKGPQFGNNISHANNTTRRRWNVNLRPVKAKLDGASKRIRVCTSCIKTGKVVKAA